MLGMPRGQPRAHHRGDIGLFDSKIASLIRIIREIVELDGVILEELNQLPALIADCPTRTSPRRMVVWEVPCQHSLLG